MYDLSPIDELLELRAEIARLQRREATLTALVQDGTAAPRLRAGWPIQMSRQGHSMGARA